MARRRLLSLLHNTRPRWMPEASASAGPTDEPSLAGIQMLEAGKMEASVGAPAGDTSADAEGEPESCLPACRGCQCLKQDCVFPGVAGRGKRCLCGACSSSTLRIQERDGGALEGGGMPLRKASHEAGSAKG